MHAHVKWKYGIEHSCTHCRIRLFSFNVVYGNVNLRSSKKIVQHSSRSIQAAVCSKTTTAAAHQHCSRATRNLLQCVFRNVRTAIAMTWVAVKYISATTTPIDWLTLINQPTNQSKQICTALTHASKLEVLVDLIASNHEQLKCTCLLFS